MELCIKNALRKTMKAVLWIRERPAENWKSRFWVSRKYMTERQKVNIKYKISLTTLFKLIRWTWMLHYVQHLINIVEYGRTEFLFSKIDYLKYPMNLFYCSMLIPKSLLFSRHGNIRFNNNFQRPSVGEDLSLVLS